MMMAMWKNICITAYLLISTSIKYILSLNRKGKNILLVIIYISSVQFSRSVMFDSLWPHESQHTRPPCPSPTPRVYQNSCPSSRWYHPASHPPRPPQTTWPASWEICMQVKKQQLELDMEQQTGSKLGKEYVKAVYCHLAYLTSTQSTSWETLDWKKHKLESRLLGERSITSDMQMTPPLCEEVLRASWWKWERRVKKLA